MDFSPVDSPILSSAMSVVGAEHAQAGDDNVPEVSMDRTYEARQAIDSHDARNVMIDQSNPSGEADFQKSVLSTLNDGMGAIINGFV